VDLALRQDPEGRGAQRVQIDPTINQLALAECLLGGHVGERADGETRSGPDLVGYPVEQAGQPEVEHLHATVKGEKQVVGLQIAMHDPLVVGSDEDIEYLVEHVEHHRHGELAVAKEALTERLPVQQLHDEVDEVGCVGAVLEDPDRAGMIDMIGRVRLADEAVPNLSVGREDRVQDLDRGDPAFGIARRVHRRHPTGAENPLEPPAPSNDLPLATLDDATHPGSIAASKGGISRRARDVLDREMTDSKRESPQLGRRELLIALGAVGACAPPPRPRSASVPNASPRAATFPRGQPPAAPPATAPPTAAPPTAAPPATRETGETPRPPAHWQPEVAHAAHPVRLCALPTPVEHCRELGEAIGVPALWVKHDDLSAEPYGGGKIRKLEFLLGEAQRRGHREVVTSGAVGSHHAVATAIFARQLGLRCRLLLMHGRRDAHTRRNLLADAYQGAALELVGGPAGVESATRRLLASESPPFVIPTGGTSPLGDLGYVNAALELQGQVLDGAMPEPDVLVVAMGTMGTAVGLTLGLELTQLSTQVVAVRASNVPTSTEARYRAEIAATRAWLEQCGISVPEPSPHRWRIEGSCLGRGYGFASPRGNAAQRAAREHGLALEPTYTAKAFAAIIGSARQLEGQTVLFWHTHSALEPPVGDASPADLPADLRGYFPPTSPESRG